MSILIPAIKKSSLKQALAAVDTSVITKLLKDQHNNTVSMATFGEFGTIVIKQGDQWECVKFTALVNDVVNNKTTLTVATNGRKILPVSPFTGGTSGFDFIAGSECIITNDGLIMSTFPNIENAQTWNEIQTFAVPPVVPTAVNANQAINKAQMEAQVNLGAADASTNAKGISKLSSTPNTVMGTLGVLNSLGTATMTIATPALASLTAHGLVVNDIVQFTTSGALPTGVTASTNYYVIATGLTTDAFQFSASLGGAAINTSGTQSGVHTLFKLATISIATPAIAYFTAHGFTAGDTIKFTTTGTLPTGVVSGTIYYVISTGLTADAFQFSATSGGTAVNTSGTQSGTHTLLRTTPYAVGNDDPRVPTQSENDALAGTSGTPSSSNKFVTALGAQLNAESYAADAGANDTYVITLSPVPVAYVTGMVVHFKANTINTGAATLNVNSLGAKTIVKYVNTTLADGDIAAGQYCTVIYDGTNFVLQNPVATPSALITIASDNLKLSADTERGTASSTWVQLKSVTVNRAGVVRFKIDIRGANTNWVEYKLSLNGFTLATGGVGNASYVTYGGDIYVPAGAKLDVSAQASATTVYIRNFRIYFDTSAETDGTVVTD